MANELILIVEDNPKNLKLAGYVAKILGGATAEELTISRPSRLAPMINAKTARVLRLTILPSLRLQADRIIE